jgi:hypothetical protein
VKPKKRERERERKKERKKERKEEKEVPRASQPSSIIGTKIYHIQQVSKWKYNTRTPFFYEG